MSTYSKILRIVAVVAMVVMVAVDAAVAGLGNVYWAPTELSNTVVWLDAADANTLWADTNGTTTATTSVARWDDKSGNTNHAVQGTGSAQPSTGVTNLNGINVISFVPNQGLQSPQPLSSNFTVIAVAQNNLLTTSPFDSNFVGSRQLVDGSQHYSLNSKGVGRYDTSSTSASSPSNYPAATPVLVAAFDRKSPNPTCVYRRNGTQEASSTTVRNWSETATRWSIGTDYPEARNYLDGYVAEVVIVHSILSDADIEKVEGYLAWKWELVDRLPVAHPYKLEPPNNPPAGTVIIVR